MSKKRRTRTTWYEKYRRSIFRQKMSEFITWIENAVQLDRKRAKLLVLMIFLSVVFLVDLVSLVVPDRPTPPPPPEFSKAQIPALIAENQLILEKDPRNFKAHLELGRIFLFIKDPDRAKIELFQAVEFAPKGNYEAHFVLGKMYTLYAKPELAAEIYGQINDRDLDKVQLLRKADSLYALSQLFYSQNKFHGSYEALQEAFDDYDSLGQEAKFKAAKHDMMLLLIDMADEAYYDEKNPTKALVYLENSQKLEENAWAYARQGYLFFEDPKIAADDFEKAYSFDSKSVNLEVFVPTLLRAMDICAQENRMSDRSYYRSVLERVRQERLVEKVHTKVITNNVEAFYERQDGLDAYLPVAYVDIVNGFLKKPIKYLKVRAVFVDENGNIVGHHDLVAINSYKPLFPQKTLNDVRLESNRYLTAKQKDTGVYKVILYFSETRPDEWDYAATKLLQR